MNSISTPCLVQKLEPMRKPVCCSNSTQFIDKREGTEGGNRRPLRRLLFSSIKPYSRAQLCLQEQLPLPLLAAAGWELEWNPRPGTPIRCDAWVVLDGVEEAIEVICPKQHVLFIAAEPAAYKSYSAAWLHAFSEVWSCQDRINHEGLKVGALPLPWFVKRSYAELQDLERAEKTEAVSGICSGQHCMRGHVQRLRCVNFLRRELGTQVHWYGRKIRFVEDKWDALAPYRFSLAIENSRAPDYWTEKIVDCFLARTVPLYDGAPNLEQYFPADSFIRIDRERPAQVAQQLRALLMDSEAEYERRLPALEEARRRCLEQYSLGSRILNWLPARSHQTEPAVLQRLEPEPRLGWWGRKTARLKRRWLGCS